MSRLQLTLLALLFASIVLPVHSQELTPRAFWPAPKGTRIATLGYSHVGGDIVPDPSLPISGVNSDIDSLHLGLLHTVNLFGRTGNIIVELPFSSGSTSVNAGPAGKFSRSYEGVGDLAATVSINLLGAPTMNRQEFSVLVEDPPPIVGVSLKVVAPTGNYDGDTAINVGANRWAVKAALGYVQPLSRRWLLEAELSTWYFDDNDDFLGATKEQASVVSIQAHLVRAFRSGWWVSLDANYYEGGRTTLAGKRLDDLQRDSKIGFTVVYPFTRLHIVKAGYAWGSTNDADERFDVYQLSYQHLF